MKKFFYFEKKSLDWITALIDTIVLFAGSLFFFMIINVVLFGGQGRVSENVLIFSVSFVCALLVSTHSFLINHERGLYDITERIEVKEDLIAGNPKKWRNLK